MYISKQDYAIAYHDYGLVADPTNQTFVAGAYEHNLKRSFELLHKAADVLEHRIVDDVHIGRIFAAMIKKVSSQLEKRLTRFVPSSGPGRSRAQSTTPIVASSPALAGPPMQRNHFAAQQPMPNLNAWNGPITNGGFNTPNLDFNDYQGDASAFLPDGNQYDQSQTVMPPPHMYSPDYNNSDGGLAGNGGNNWFSIDMRPMIDQSLHSGDNAVNHSHYGPTVGGGDMLDAFMVEHNFHNNNHLFNMHDGSFQ
jgi:hypothetical protein